MRVVFALGFKVGLIVFVLFMGGLITYNYLEGEYVDNRKQLFIDLFVAILVCVFTGVLFWVSAGISL